MRINFKISETKYSLDTDANQYTLVRHSTVQDEKSKRFGQTTETQIGYYSNIVNALNRAVKYEMGISPDEITLKEFIDRYEASMELINKQLQGK
jgi:hypothetical protein